MNVIEHKMVLLRLTFLRGYHAVLLNWIRMVKQQLIVKGRRLLNKLVLVNKLVPCAWLSSGVFEV